MVINMPDYALSQPEFLVEIEANGKTLKHKLRKPTLDDLVKREDLIVYETEEIADGQDAIRADTERADAALWDRIAISVTGYRTGDQGPDAEIHVTSELAAKIPSSHKATAVRGLYASTCEVEAGDDEGFNLDGESFTVRQDIGPDTEPYAVIRHTLRQPTEGERQDYRRRSSQTVLVRGSKRTKARVQTNLKPAVELYDKLFLSISGVEENGQAMKLVDPLWKRQVVMALMASFESSLSD